MLFLSHIYTAFCLKDKIKPNDDSVYFLCSILPDIRYTANIEREKTHVQISSLDKVFKKTSDEYKGYKLHLLIDVFMNEWEFLDKLKSNYPKFIHRFLKTPVLNTVVDIYSYEKIVRKEKIFLSRVYNTNYKKLGIAKKDLKEYVDIMQKILSNFSMETVEEFILTDKKLKNIKKLQTYRKIGKFIMNNRIVRNYLVSKVDKVFISFLIDLEYKYNTNLENVSHL